MKIGPANTRQVDFRMHVHPKNIKFPQLIFAFPFLVPNILKMIKYVLLVSLLVLARAQDEVDALAYIRELIEESKSNLDQLKDLWHVTSTSK